MQFSRWTHSTRRGRSARLVLTVAAGAVALGGLAACDGGRGGGGGGGAGGLIRATIAVNSISQQGTCENVGVKVTPVNLQPNPPKMSNDREFVTQVALTRGADNVSCTGSAQTIPMAPGTWRFMVMLPSEIAQCEREIAAGGNLQVTFTDGELSCT